MYCMVAVQVWACWVWRGPGRSDSSGSMWEDCWDTPAKVLIDRIISDLSPLHHHQSLTLDLEATELTSSSDFRQTILVYNNSLSLFGLGAPSLGFSVNASTPSRHVKDIHMTFIIMYKGDGAVQ